MKIPPLTPPTRRTVAVSATLVSLSLASLCFWDNLVPSLVFLGAAYLSLLLGNLTTGR